MLLAVMEVSPHGSKAERGVPAKATSLGLRVVQVSDGVQPSSKTRRSIALRRKKTTALLQRPPASGVLEEA